MNDIREKIEQAERAYDEGDIDLLKELIDPLLELNVPEAIRLNACFHEAGTSEEECDRAYVEGMFRAAELGDKKALYRVGTFYDIGDFGVPQDKERASHIFKQLSDDGDAHCMWIHASELIWGNGTYPKDVEKGIQLLENAVTCGSSGACITLATFYNEGSFGYCVNIKKRDELRVLALKYDCTTFDPFA